MKKSKKQHQRRSSQEMVSTESAPFWCKGMWQALGGIVLLSALMFSDLLMAPSPRALSQAGTDLTSGEADGRVFLFEHLRHGDLPMWCPNLYSGTPFLPELQSGALYPLNFPLLPFSIERAVNLHVWMHLALLGMGLCLWIRAMGRQPLACFCAGALGMFCGPVFLHIYAGHLTNIAAMAWAPWLLLGTELAARRRFSRGWAVGAFALGLQLQTGQAQYVYYTCIAVGIYSLVQLPWLKHRIRFLITMAAIVATAVALAAVQLLPGLVGLGQTARGGKGVGYEFASMFSFPPENLVTLLAPGFFGDMTGHAYWGRCYLWEMSLFFSVSGLLLALVGIGAAGSATRRRLGLTAGLLLILALGSHTPLFQLLYSYAPGFNSLRGNCKFIFPMILFVLAFVAHGIDALRRGEQERSLGFVAAGAAAVCFVGGLVISNLSNTDAWRSLFAFIRDTRESYLPPQIFASAEFLTSAAGFSTQSLLVAAVAFGLASTILLLKLKPERRTAALVVLSIGEVLYFAWNARVTCDLSEYRKATGVTEIQKYVAGQSSDKRVLQVSEPNSVLYTGAQNIWGYGAIPQRRYLEFMAWTQGVNPDETTQYVDFRQLDPLFSMLRLECALLPNGKELKVVPAPTAPMDRLHLVSRYRVLPTRDAIFNFMRSKSFDPRVEVVLEKEPNPVPVESGTAGTAKLTASANDWMEIEADIQSPCILLVTDPFAPSWKVKPLAGSVQQGYDVLPANYILRAIPLAAGHHKMRMEYVPAGFALGKWISVLGWLGLGTVSISIARRSD